MNLSHLRYFVKLAQVKHYTKAAEQLCITQPSLSHAISQLETELGVILFEKGPHGTELTDFGKQFFASVNSSLNILDNGIKTIKHGAKGNGLIRIGCLRTLGTHYVPEVVAAFKEAHPDKDLHFTFSTDMTRGLLEGLVEDSFDVVFASKPLNPSQFDITAVSKQDLVLITPKDHPLAEKYVIDLRDTLQYPYIAFDSTSGLRPIISRMFSEIKGSPQVVYEVSEDQVIAGLVAKKFGIAVVPYMDILLQLDVKILPIAYPSYERKFYAIFNKNHYLPPVVQNFRNFIISHIPKE
ncbi:LysR family transcriptional regulator [Megasphaera vaginalis (ex Bordigoni et al. 2020)]|uniref:LysR family transcriptional regulator n=1 Tax=Megasphaera vaginalis (ex Bordigoni et al. 2020) TaxID=2045301 RepID=UPI000C7982CD|nr:LysR family transcriptional regulator [Megasphaera vaginalis (ex Bordigoni et al. 2020)]